MPDHDLAERAHRLITTTSRPVADIAAELGLSPAALERRLERAYGARSRQLRTGQAPTPGRPTTGRTPWQVRLTEDERATVESAVARERGAGAATDGEALARAVARPTAKRRSR